MPESRAAALATLATATACWAVAVDRMDGMDMGVRSTLGSLGFFAGVWLVMMAAMMLPAAAPAVARHVALHGRLTSAPVFVASYLAVWTLVGLASYSVYRPHGTTAAGVLVIAAGLYELTPLKRHFRMRCREAIDSGLRFGVCCVGSSIGLMVVLAALGIMSVTWMVAVAGLVTVQKLLPPRRTLDVALAAAIVALGVVTIVAPASLPGLIPSM
jgi:predicted metal-binding membrane protein